MAIFQEYKAIYNNKIKESFEREIKVYPTLYKEKILIPFSHNCQEKCNICSHTCYKSLGKLMRENLVFYCFGEQEIVEKVKSGLFSNLTTASLYAYKNRLPKRNELQDGLQGEVLFDLLIQNILPNANKLAVRTILRQNDNNEIKGYDLTYFTNENGKITLWLGQAKLGDKAYCKKGISDDLKNKFNKDYLSNQIYFISEKQSGLTQEGIELTNIINKLNMLTIEKSNQERANAFLNFLVDKGITVNIPCLLAYGEGSIYGNINDVEKQIKKESEVIRKYFTLHRYEFDGFNPNLIFFVFPIEDLHGLRGSEGFYDGLR